jgi:glutamyl-tRNA synthetase
MVRGTGDPLYTLVNPVDDALMGITHVLRGEDLLPSTPRQIALYAALTDIGVAQYTPEFGHLPFVTGEGNRKLSKRDPSSNLFQYRDDGFIAEGMVNYLALLGWSIAEDRDIFSPQELIAAFDGHRISGNPARFDRKKAEAINSTHLRMLAPSDFAARLSAYVVSSGRVPTLGAAQHAIIQQAAPLVQERCILLKDAAEMIDFLLVEEGRFDVDPTAAVKVLKPEAGPVLAAAISALEKLDRFTAGDMEPALRAALIDELGLKPKVAFAPVRVAATGRTISPPLYESLELLGRDRTLLRLRAAQHLAER